MDALTGDRVEVSSRGCNERLTFTGLHFSDVAQVEGRGTHQLDVEVTHTQGALRRFTHHRERLREEVVEALARFMPFTELVRHGLQLFIRELLDGVFECVDL